jgi:hypothetical protein
MTPVCADGSASMMGCRLIDWAAFCGRRPLTPAQSSSLHPGCCASWLTIAGTIKSAMNACMSDALHGLGRAGPAGSQCQQTACMALLAGRLLCLRATPVALQGNGTHTSSDALGRMLVPGLRV